MNNPIHDIWSAFRVASPGTWKIMLLSVPLFFAIVVHADDRTPGDIITAISARSRESYPILPNLSTELQGLACNEIDASATVRNAVIALDPTNRNIDWFQALKVLEHEKAVWCLQACLTHYSDDVQVLTLRALASLGDPRAVPFLLEYGSYMAVVEGGSENATLHGIIQHEIVNTLNALTGEKVSLRNPSQDPDGLKKGILIWARAYLKSVARDH